MVPTLYLLIPGTELRCNSCTRNYYTYKKYDIWTKSGLLNGPRKQLAFTLWKWSVPCSAKGDLLTDQALFKKHILLESNVNHPHAWIRRHFIENNSQWEYMKWTVHTIKKKEEKTVPKGTDPEFWRSYFNHDSHHISFLLHRSDILILL